MKKLSRTLAAAGFLAGCLMAQPNPPDPAMMVQHRVERLTSLLNLTAAQVTQATTIFTNAETAISPLRTTLSGYRTSLETAVKSNATANIEQIAASIGQTDGQITAVQSKADAAFYAILTADQQAKLNALPGGGFGGPGRGGPGGFGPRGRPPGQ